MKGNITIHVKSKAHCKNGLLVTVLVNLFLFIGIQQVHAQNDLTNQAQKSFATIGDHVWIDNNKNGLQDPGEPGVPNVLVILYDSLLKTIATQYTDATGHYTFNNIQVPASGEKAFIVGFYNIPPNYAYTNSLPDSIITGITGKLDPVTGRTPLFRLHAGSVRDDIDAGIKSAPGVVLPLTIDQFNGYYDNAVTQLKWTTFSEINMDHFDIERSTDGTNFRQIGRIYATGNSSSNTSYSYMDISAERGANFYRLAMIDNDGNYTYSSVITLSVDVKGITVSVVYPNPFSKKVVVKLDCTKPEQITIRVIDNAGSVVRTQLANLSLGENNIVIQNVADLPSGIYYLEVIGDHRSMKTKLMKQQ